MRAISYLALSLILSSAAYAGGKESEWGEIISLRRSKAASGDANSQVVMGTNHLQGVPGLVNQDEVMAANYFKQAAEADDQFGQLELARCYLEGTGVAKSDSEAYKWFLLAAAKGNKTAKQMIRKLEDSLTAKQREEGQTKAEAFGKALTERPTQTDLGRYELAKKELASGMAYLTRGEILATTEQAVAAIPHLKIAADLGDATAQHRLSFLLSIIKEIRDPFESAKWLIRAAHQGQSDAQFDLAFAYVTKGSGVKTDPILAQKWFRVLKMKGASSELLNPLEKHILKSSTAEERAEGDQLAEHFRKQPEL
jgi:TPR repeat protein